MEDVDFKQVGGLEKHIECIREMILYPLIYQDIYKRFNIKPSRGVLFHGPPGTGKTLIAKALHHECNKHGRKITFFSQKGAECLNMWVGDSEKKLRFLFAEAHLRRPSIIFFDEIDSLTPIRSERQDHVHTSVVSTLLALMDGLDTLTDVFVIGATNRIEVIDPALRRPGRFDRELYFPLPEFNARKDIIHLYVDNWEKNSRPSNEFIEEVATDMVGYSGADIKALCDEAVKCSLRRKLPNVSTTENKKRACFKSFQVEICDFIAAKSKIAPLAHRTLHNPRKKIPHTIQPLLQCMIDRILEDVHKYNPQFLNRNKEGCGSHDLLSNPCLLLTGSSLQCQTNYIAPAILHSLQHLPVYMLDSTTLHENSTTEESCIHKFKQMYQNLPAILYTPHINSWWDIVGDATRIVFINEINKVKNNIFHLSTAHVRYSSLSPSLQKLFDKSQHQVVEMNNPTRSERNKFFQPLFNINCIIPALKQEGMSNISISNLQPLDQVNSTKRGGKMMMETRPVRCSQRLRHSSTISLPDSSASRGQTDHNVQPPTKKIKIEPKDEYQDVKIKQETEVAVRCYNIAAISLSQRDKVTIDNSRLSQLLEQLLDTTKEYPISTLETMYSQLNTCIFSFQDKWNRNELPNELETIIRNFNKDFVVTSQSDEE